MIEDSDKFGVRVMFDRMLEISLLRMSTLTVIFQIGLKGI